MVEKYQPEPLETICWSIYCRQWVLLTNDLTQYKTTSYFSMYSMLRSIKGMLDAPGQDHHSASITISECVKNDSTKHCFLLLCCVLGFCYLAQLLWSTTQWLGLTTADTMFFSNRCHQMFNLSPCCHSVEQEEQAEEEVKEVAEEIIEGIYWCSLGLRQFREARTFMGQAQQPI